jgi:hypothetical protein
MLITQSKRYLPVTIAIRPIASMIGLMREPCRRTDFALRSHTERAKPTEFVNSQLQSGDSALLGGSDLADPSHSLSFRRPRIRGGSTRLCDPERPPIFIRERRRCRRGLIARSRSATQALANLLSSVAISSRLFDARVHKVPLSATLPLEQGRPKARAQGDGGREGGRTAVTLSARESLAGRYGGWNTRYGGGEGWGGGAGGRGGEGEDGTYPMLGRRRDQHVIISWL